eukprot:2152277-Rhodomonas_salina.2
MYNLMYRIPITSRAPYCPSESLPRTRSNVQLEVTPLPPNRGLLHCQCTPPSRDPHYQWELYALSR